MTTLSTPTVHPSDCRCPRCLDSLRSGFDEDADRDLRREAEQAEADREHEAAERWRVEGSATTTEEAR